jgi:DNA-binding CsgD family transcriptional regulator
VGKDVRVAAAEQLVAGQTALAQGRWSDARAAFEACLAQESSADACFGLAAALWWTGESQASVDRCMEAYAHYRRAGQIEPAIQCAAWLAITYKANFANAAAANGWLARADRLLEALEPGLLHAWVWIARAYRLPDLGEAQELTERALALAHAAGDVDLELGALAQLGLIRVGRGDVEGGFALLDEAVAAALAGEPSSLDTVVYACCDMLNACELASDLERAAQWCAVADRFTETYGCPFLYAECRIFYGSVLVAKGRWADGERELAVGLRITEGTCPGLYTRALSRLAALRVRQGRLEEAEAMEAGLGAGATAATDAALTRAALLLARGDAAGASRHLERRLRLLEAHRATRAETLDLLVDARLDAGDTDGARVALEQLADVVPAGSSDRLSALVAGARGRVALVMGDGAAISELEDAVAAWTRAGQPFEAARAQCCLGGALAAVQPELAIEHLRAALATFDTLGASMDADRAAALLRSLGVAGRAGARGVGTLTEREQEVLALLGAGLSNPEIAARLFVSRKTASHHVSRILAKLDLRNRAEAAAYAARVLP